MGKQELKVLRKDTRDSYVEVLREGRKQRAQTFTDRKKQGNKDACKGDFSAEED